MLQLRVFLSKRWRALCAVAAAVLGAVLVFLRLRSRPTDPIHADQVLKPVDQADAAHAAGARERQAALAARAAQEDSARGAAELRTAAELRAAEDTLRTTGNGASESITAANNYADRVNRRRQGL